MSTSPAGSEGGLRTHRVGVIPGDGTGPEVVREGLKIIAAVADGFALDTVQYDLGGERYLRTGETLPDSVLSELRSLDAIYLGAVGHPDVKPGILERDLLLRIRFELDQYVNLRPVKLYPGVRSPVADLEPGDLDMVFVRENSEGLYTGAGGSTGAERATRSPSRSRSTRAGEWGAASGSRSVRRPSPAAART